MVTPSAGQPDSDNHGEEDGDAAEKRRGLLVPPVDSGVRDVSEAERGAAAKRNQRSRGHHRREERRDVMLKQGATPTY